MKQLKQCLVLVRFNKCLLFDVILQLKSRMLELSEPLLLYFQNRITNWAWWHVLVIRAFSRLRQEE